MGVYISLAIYIILISIIFKKNKNLLFILTFIPLLLFFGTRSEMGADYYDYLFKYEQAHDWDLAHYLIDPIGGKFEPGFFLLIKLAPSFDALVFLCTLLGLFPISLFFYKFIPDNYYPLAFALYLFSFKIFESFVAMRSGIVVGLFMLAIVLRFQGYNKTAICLVLFSGLFHTSGFFLVPVLLLSDVFLKRHFRSATICVILLMVSALIFPTIFGDLFIEWSSPIQELEAYRGHINNTGYGLGFYVFSLVRFVFTIYILSLIKKGLIDDNHIWIAWMTILCYFFHMVQGIDVMYRFIFYFYLISIPFKCYVLKVDKSEYSKIYLGLSIVYLIYTFVSFIQSDHGQLYYSTYQSFLF